jgi:DNA-binding response OmpR family regulator
MTVSTPPKGTILVADDDAHIVELVSLYLRRAGFEVEPAYDGTEALRKAAELKPALLVLDIMMPGEDGLQVCRALRRRGGVPVVFLSARSSDIDKIAGLRLGADDYVTKPFNPEELVARVEAVLRRAHAGSQPPPERIFLGHLDLDVPARSAHVTGQPLALTPKEFDLLVTLGRFPGVTLDREQLLDLVWGTSFYSIRTVDVHIARLREKLRGSGVHIDTVWGTGYRLGVGD